MAKKVTIEGSNKLHGLSDPWGGQTGNSAETPYNQSVPANTEWGMNRGEVERFIKEQFGSKVGYLHRTEDNLLLGFATEDDYLAWVNDPDNNPPIASSTLPSLVNEDVYQVRAYLQAIPNEVQRSRAVTIGVRGTSIVQLATGGSENITESLNVIVETSPTGNAGTWTSRIAGTITANVQTYKEFSLESYLSLGTNHVRIRVAGNQATSIPISFTLNVVNLYLTPASDFSNLPTEQVELSYLIGGSINKTIQFEFGTGRGNNFVSSYTTAVSLGEQTWAQTAKTFQFTEASLLTAGRHTVRARLWVNSEVYTDWVESEYLVGGASAMVVVNDIQTGLSNWTAVKFFDWAVYTPDGEPIAVVFKLYDENDENVYATWNFTADNNTEYSFTTQLAINVSENISLFAGNMHIEDANGNELAPSVLFTFTNSAEYSPVSGADFIMLPANRNNSEVNKDTIINEAGISPSVVASSFIGFGWLNDGWINVPKDLNNEELGTLRALHIPAGHKVEIDYNPFSLFTAGANANTTFEMDFRTSNILDSDEAIVRIGTLVDNKIWGFEMLPTKAYMMTQENRTIEDQDADWAEDIRTHLAVNIVSVIYGPTKTLHYVRIFINGIIEREFLFNTSDRFTAASGVKIELGNSSSDLDIFSMRNYKTALTTSDVMRNYRASMDTTEEKMAFKDKNDITLNEKISFSRCVAMGLNVIGHTGPLPKYGKAVGNPTYEGVSLQIHINGDEEHSGILTNLEAKGQGTTAMGYYDWNQSYKITGSTKHLTEAGVQKSVDDGTGYSIADDEYAATKLVGKINFASSMQSHKLGLTWIFTEVFKELVDANKISKPSQFITYPNARIAVFEKPFLFFHRETENDEWEYKYLMTFGAGKGDKPTFGFNKNTTGDLLMVEGADNDPALCNFARPWDDSITYNPNSEAWFDGSTKSINFGFGKTTKVNEGGTEVEYPSSDAAIAAIKAFWNFVYEHHTGITYYTGTLENLQAGVAYVEGNKPVRTNGLYWIANDTSMNASRYDLFRYQNGSWVPAGANQTTLNLLTQYTALNNNVAPSWNGKTPLQINNEIKALRRAHFKANAELYFHVDDALYHSCFIKLFAGTDNRAKNTYYYTDPTTLKIRWMQDDLDTVIKTNNLGQNRKPYYVEEHDTDASGAFYWQGEGNAFYNLLEEVYCDVTNDSNDRMPAMMREMLSVMAAKGGSVMGYLLQRLLFVQDYFPAIAYNEQARLVYEAAQAAQTGANPEYSHSIQAITQSCGSQRWSEYQWLKDRVMYISSWCEFGEFAAGTQNVGAMTFRSDEGQFNFSLTPAKWLYPRIGKGTSRVPAKSDNSVLISRVRVEPKTTFDYLGFTSEGDTDIYIRGIDYLLDIGDMNVYIKPAAFRFLGKRLQQIAVNPNGTDANHLAASSLTNTAMNIKSFVFRNVDTVAGTLDLSTCYRLERIDISGSTFTGITLPKTERLTKLILPATLTSLVMDGQPNVNNTTMDANATFSIAGGASLTAITIKNCPYVPSYSVINTAKAAGAQLTDVVLNGVFWEGVDAAVISWLADIPNCELTGNIAISNAVSFDLRVKMLQKWPNIGTTLFITYNLVSLSSVKIGGESYISEQGLYQYKLVSSNSNANNFNSLVWSVGWKGSAYGLLEDYVDVDTYDFARTGKLVVKQVANSSAATITITATIGNLVPVTYDVGLYYREAEVGDFVFADGSWSDKDNPLKTVIGVCFYSENGDRRMLSVQDTIYGGMRRSAYTNQQYWRIYAWGLANIAASNGGVQNVSVSGYSSVYDLPSNAAGEGMKNYSSHGLSSNAISDATMRDENGFKEFSDGAASDIELREVTTEVLRLIEPTNYLVERDVVAGTKIPSGRYNTLLIIKHRNKILLGTERAIPVEQNGHDEFADLLMLMEAEQEEHSGVGDNSTFARESFYYPAASLCYSYNILRDVTLKTGETLNPKFGLHKWYLPSAGELLRILWFHSKGYQNVSEDSNAIFAKAYQAGHFAKLQNWRQSNTNDSYWSSTERSGTTAWWFQSVNANGSNTLGEVASFPITTYDYSYYKGLNTQIYARAACAF